MTRLRLTLLGPFQVTLDGEPAKGFDSDKVRALLAYLVVEADRPHRREALAGLLWPESSEKAARTNLRRALANLRQVISDGSASPPFLTISRQSIQFNAGSNHWLDVTVFSRLLASARGEMAKAVQLEEAVKLYRGRFLEGFTLADCAAFEEWQLITGEALQREAVDALRRLAGYYEQQGLYNQALPHARRQVTLEPWDEEGHRQVMRLLARSGRRNEALAQYETCRLALAEALDVVPDAETEALAERIRSGQEEEAFAQLTEQAIRGYELRERLGAGSFGVVYRAYQPAVKRDVAVKIIQPEYANQPDFIRRFDVEAQLAARLEHPHIVPLYDYWRDPEGAYLVMRWLKAGSLQEALSQGPWSAEAAADLLDQIAAALNTAHRRGVIHRDIKPANILLDEEGNAYLSDFGVAILAEMVQLSGLSATVADAFEVSGSPEYISPEQIRRESLTAAVDVYCLGIVLYVVLTGQHPFPDTPQNELPAKHLTTPLPSVRDLRSDLPPAADEVIQRATAKGADQRYADAPALARAFREATLSETVTPQAAIEEIEVANPYKGLRPFQEADADDFFGRDALVERLLDRLAIPDPAPPDAGTGRLLAVVGPSGSGKTSVVKAGLIPALRQGALPGSEKWFVVEMTPGAHPYEELEAALLQITIQPAADLWELMQSGEQGFRRAIHLALPDSDSQLLLVIDQFEELFTLTEDKGERLGFLLGLSSIVNDPGSRVRLVVTLRADYYDRPLQHPEFGELIRHNTEIVLPLNQEEVAQAIVDPAGQAGLSLEPGLVATISDDVRQEPGALPLLQYALTELFEYRQAQRLTLEAYEAIGGVAGAIAQRAEALYTNLEVEGQETSRQLFLRLVALGQEPNEGVQPVNTRRRVFRSELEALQKPEGTNIPALIDAYGAARLLTFDRDPLSREPTVEIAHEALLREWPRLKSWITASQEDLRQHQRLVAAMSEWIDAGREPSFLLQGGRLDHFAAWAEETDLALASSEASYLENCLAERQAQQAAEAARLDKERALERRARNLRIALGIAVVVVVIGAVIGIVIVTTNLASGVERAISSVIQPEEASQMVNEETREASTAANMIYLVPQGRGVVYNPAGEMLAISGHDALATIREAESGQVLFELSGHRDRVNNLAYSFDGDYLATTSMDGTVKVWDAGTGQEVITVEVSDAELVSPALNPDGSLLAATSYNVDWRRLTTHVWDTTTGQEIMTAGFGDQIGGLAFSPDGSMLAMPGTVGKVTIWDPASGKQLFMVRDDNATVLDMSFSPDSRRLATANIDGTARVWDLASRERLMTMRGHEGAVYGVDFSPDGRMIATAGQDGSARVWDARNGRELFTFYGHSAEALNVAFSPDGSRLASSGSDDKTIVWDISP